MDSTQIVYMLAALVLAGLIAFTMTPAVSVLAYKIGAIDVPKDNRRMHKKPTPRIGGLAIFAGFVVSTLVFCDLTPELIAIYVGGLIIVAVGVIDDVFRINAWIKLLAQIGVALIAVSQGVVVEYINFFGTYVNFGVWSIPITVVWIVGLTNAINLIDGLDGLSCGVSAICSISLLLVMILKGELVVATLTAIVVGSCLGFLPFNSNPAKIFMGDTGALFLGFTLAVISVFGVFKLHAVLAFLVPFAIFALPLFDTLFAICRRILSGKSPFAPDRGHIHHKLIDMGFTQKESVKILYAICGIFGLVAVFCTESMFHTMRVTKSILIAVIAMGLFILNYIILKDPDWRKHSGLTEDEMTVSEYINELDPEKARKIEAHNGGHVEKKDESAKEPEPAPEEMRADVGDEEQK